MPVAAGKEKVLPAELRDINFSVPLLDRYKSSIPQPKRSKTSAKSSPKLQLIEFMHFVSDE